MSVISAKASNLRSNLWELYSATLMVLTRLWLWVVAIPAGIVLSMLLVSNDFSASKAIASVVTASHESASYLQPGSVAGTYQWRQCVGSAPVKVTPPSALACKDTVIREGTLAEAIAPGAAALGQLYLCLVLTLLLLMSWLQPRSEYALRHKLSCALGFSKPD